MRKCGHEQFHVRPNARARDAARAQGKVFLIASKPIEIEKYL
jgi:hypothetical protein